MTYAEPRFLNAGDEAVVVELGDDISPETNRRVHDLAAAAGRLSIDGVTGLVPSYRSLLVQYDGALTTQPEVRAALVGLLDATADEAPTDARVVHVPVLYGGEHGPDIDFVAQHCGLTLEELVDAHSTPEYLVYMMGFSPGFPYLGGLPKSLVTPRLPTPRVEIPAGSVGIAEAQTGVYPVASPGGWRLIGRTPMSFFDPFRDPPSLIEAGDFVRFTPMENETQYEEVASEVESGAYRPVVEQAAPGPSG